MPAEPTWVGMPVLKRLPAGGGALVDIHLRVRPAGRDHRNHLRRIADRVREPGVAGGCGLGRAAVSTGANSAAIPTVHTAAHSSATSRRIASSSDGRTVGVK